MLSTCLRRCVCPLAALSMLVWAASDVDRMLRSLTQRFGGESVGIFRDWRVLVSSGALLGEMDKLTRINEFFNRRLRFEEDSIVWHQADYWATPIEFIGRRSGDCEDYVIAKYFSLIEMGVDHARLRLTYVRAAVGGPGSGVTQAHMILSYYAASDVEPLVLDNLITDIRPASRRPDLTPVFSFNGDGVWMAGADRPSSPVDRLARWNELVLKTKAEGYEP